jgi:hypothetical protein
MEQKLVSRRNHYRGINPHLNSSLQMPGNDVVGPSVWPSFHASHIGDMTNFLNQKLPDRYIARTEQSLQIREIDEDRPTKKRRPEPDVTIYGSETPQRSGASISIITPTWTAELQNTLEWDEDELVPSIIIRDLADHTKLGTPVARIELLSPSNLGSRAEAKMYTKNRLDALYSGTPLIELHYVHEYPAPISDYPPYPLKGDSQR